ncbi:glycosyltransferase family 4 protein [Hanstruepera marina]|uniref:glycosyltransferase family 4 protein n=1 Tax=Hanstruepera marina TaxID=2873265 RepID=UPI001CA6ECED|nr:glycosyltransferase family 4 protein [Hanstruepera marina]
MKPLKIAIFSGAIPSSTFIEELIKGVAQHHKVLLFGVIETPKIYKSKNIKVYSTPYSHIKNLMYTLYRLAQLLLKRPLDSVKLFQEIKKYPRFYDQWIWFSKFLPIVLHKPDVIHLQWARDMEFYTFLKTKFNIPVIVSLRGAHINYTPIVEGHIAQLYKKYFPVVDGFHAVSVAIALEAQKYNAEPSKINLIHSPVPRKTFKLFSNIKKNNGPIKILSIGRFHWKKGYKYALDACSILKEKGIQFEYTIISSNKVSEEILFQMYQLDLVNQVKIVKGKTQNELFQVMKTYDVLLLPSLEEGIANVVLEAMALGLPVISTDCGGMTEVVKLNESGWLVPVRNPNAMAQAILDFQETPENVVNSITQQAHDLVKKEFNKENCIEKFLTLYTSVANK